MPDSGTENFKNASGKTVASIKFKGDAGKIGKKYAKAGLNVRVDGVKVGSGSAASSTTNTGVDVGGTNAASGAPQVAQSQSGQADAAQAEFDKFMEFIGKQGVERGATDDVVHEQIADSLDQIPDVIKNYEPDDIYGQAVDDLGAHEFNQRLPRGFHVTTETPGGPVSVHQDAFDPLQGPVQNFKHFTQEVVPLGRGQLRSIHVNRHPDLK